MNENHKRYLVALTAFVYAIVCTYLLITGVAFQVAEQSSGGTDFKYKIFGILAPVLFTYLGFHHLTKDRGEEKISLLTFLLGFFGAISLAISLPLIYQNDGNLFANILLSVLGLIQLLLCYWCYKNKAYIARKSVDSDKFELWQELFDDSINLYASAEEKSTLKASLAAKLAALAIAHRVGEQQKNELISNARYVQSMSKKLGLASTVIEKYDEVLSAVEQEEWTVVSGARYMEEIAELDPQLQEAVNSFNAKYFKDKFPSHFN